MWCVLRAGALLCYAGRLDRVAGERLAVAAARADPGEAGAGAGFSVMSQAGEVMHCLADTAAVREDWLGALGGDPGSPPPLPPPF